MGWRWYNIMNTVTCIFEYGFKNGRASTMWHSEMQQWLCNIIAKTVND